jgi:predicted dehydrogenase
MNTKIKVGIIGIGFMGSTHFRIYKDNPLAEVKAIADVDEAKLRGDWSKIIGNIGEADNNVPVDLTGINTYPDAYVLINNPDIDLVDICLPTYLHAEYTIAALRAGKHVLCEKPIARNVHQARDILIASRNSEKFLMIGMCVRFWPEYQHAFQLVKSGKLGKIKSATFKRVSPTLSGISWEDWFMKNELSGSALLDLHLHDTDAIHYFFGRPKRVRSFGLKGFRSDSGIDHVFTNYEFDNDIFVFGEGCWAAAGATPFEMSFLIIGEKGTIRLSENGYKVIYEDGTIESPSPAKPGLPTGWHAEIDYFLACIDQNIKPDEYLTIEEAVNSLAIIEAEKESIIKNRSVDIKYN